MPLSQAYLHKSVVIAILLAVILTSIEPVHSAEVKATAYSTTEGITIAWKNPNLTTVSVKLYWYNGTMRYIHTSNAYNRILEIPLGNATYNLTVYESNHSVIQGWFTVGTPISTGFKEKIKTAFDGDLFPLAMVIALAFTVAAISIGKEAGLPILVGTYFILAFGPGGAMVESWPVRVILLLVFIGFGLVLARMTESGY